MNARQKAKRLKHPHERGMYRAMRRFVDWATVHHPEWFYDDDLDGFCDWLTSVHEKRWFKRIRDIKGINVIDGRGSPDAGATPVQFGEIFVGELAMGRGFRGWIHGTHELAHLTQPEEDEEMIEAGLTIHGPEFIGVWLYIMRRAMGRHYTEMFQEILREEGVTWKRCSPKRK